MDLVILAIIAGLVLAKLYLVLGQKTGAPPPALKDSTLKDGAIKDNAISPKVNVGENKIPLGERSEFGEALEEISKAQIFEQKYNSLYSKITQVRQIMSDFDPIIFEQNATKAYEAIIEAFSRGDEAALRPLLNDEVYSVYSAIIKSRADGENSNTEIVKLADPEIRNIEISNISVHIDVYFSATLKDTGKTPRNTQEIWTFERIIGSNSPIWRLIAVETS